MPQVPTMVTSESDPGEVETLSYSTDPHHSDTEDDASKVKQIAGKEERNVKFARWIVLVVFLTCAASLSTTMFYIVSRSDENRFEAEYENFVRDIIALIQWETQNNMALMQDLAASITSAAFLSNSTFPFLTNPYFEISGGYVDGLTGIMSISFSPHVTAEEQDEWEKYAVDNQAWLEEGARLRKVHPQHKSPLDGSFQDHEERKLSGIDPVHPRIFRLDENGEPLDIQAAPSQLMAPVWQIAPTPADDPSLVNYNLLDDPLIAPLYSAMLQTKDSLMSDATSVDFLFKHAFDPSEEYLKALPYSFFLEPVFSSFEPNASIVGFLTGITAWKNYFNNIIPEGTNGIICLVKDACGKTLSFELRGPKPIFLGYGDHHDSKYEKLSRVAPIEKYGEIVEGMCPHTLYIYPSTEFRESFNTSDPFVYTAVVAGAFILTGLVFFVYDVAVNRRQRETMANAERTGAIVDSMFPKNVRERLLADADEQKKLTAEKRGMIDDSKMTDEDNPFKTRPIADLFPSVTVMFADIAGFTAWSSAREPSQVFVLLETLYSAFDTIAKRRKIFKVETVGDCYVAACGLPSRRQDHAVAMARFARDCIEKMNVLTKKLETSLGPDTADLALRVGLHSGPVTAGVLRGENARFQLFGDTMNTTSRVESSGVPNKIHVSQECADQVRSLGKGHWLSAREDKVYAKGKGEIATYWLDLVSASGSAADSASVGDSSNHGKSMSDLDNSTSGTRAGIPDQVPTHSAKQLRLIDWNTDVLVRLLRAIVANRRGSAVGSELRSDMMELERKSDPSSLVIDEVKEVICLPRFDSSGGAVTKIDADKVVLPEDVTAQLRNFVSTIALMHNDNFFHNFEHASHVTMSTVKLLSRIVAPDIADDARDTADAAKSLHDHTYGITSDPMTQFACVLSALIHDCDHQGVPNTQLVKEETQTAAYYNNRSVAEQNSVDIAWNLLMEPQFASSRACIYETGDEFKRFRALVVNCVMATDIMDKDLKALRNTRWSKAFDENHTDDDISTSVNRKATIVIEHLIQASDVAHTMQHWHVYRKWNERLFCEMYKAYASGRSEKNPAEFWYKGEIGFFDFYIIPLAKKLKDCGVFGVSSDEYLNYAMKNREEWEARGEEMVSKMVQELTLKAE